MERQMKQSTLVMMAVTLACGVFLVVDFDDATPTQISEEPHVAEPAKHDDSPIEDPVTIKTKRPSPPLSLPPSDERVLERVVGDHFRTHPSGKE